MELYPSKSIEVNCVSLEQLYLGLHCKSLSCPCPPNMWAEHLWGQNKGVSLPSLGWENQQGWPIKTFILIGFWKPPDWSNTLSWCLLLILFSRWRNGWPCGYGCGLYLKKSRFTSPNCFRLPGWSWWVCFSCMFQLASKKNKICFQS